MIIFKKEYNRLFLRYLRRSIEEYNMIEPGDKVAVGLSGGKDSIFLLFALRLIQMTSLKNFELIGINIDLGFETNLASLECFCIKNNIPIIIEKTNIAEVVFNDREEKKPCSLCSKLRKGALIRVAKANNVNKIALGHNSDDVIETLFMNVLKVGKLGTFHPNISFDDKNINIIRPLIYLKEDLIQKLTTKYDLPVIKSSCPKDKRTTREDMKQLLIKLENIYPDAQRNILTSLSNVDFKNIWNQK
ncbi:tRNA 2-thiocytidine biosynthesis protein TtcA [Clostridium botulinum]|uniref:Potassium ABC transporter ATPase n=1 Tax=Clostridium botulinum C/D str. DC5 TaxID=1443128 RepID=A0A0A0IHB7_CLOBO|nr:ATP-binding protein [Clostridium botulinum]KEI05593.1 potassium ABC transporter ATPase [Clostridium botulinum C/D str. BKT75002]KEI09652.1 potassium ABC transporter ATPase [Clostridium botulinum C/D str. BKT2873]KGM95615.1 potassium ABC transporter ATPase [Clostridium botulinum D str. CCUG 7971]KGM98960.1 potassium ABC transporter ATPase [Clostridium botulinum C/D str. DC5]KOC49264.1 potassium ABC transporter ATPase [Clostridium botulinum]